MTQTINNVRFVGRVSGRYSLPNRAASSGVSVFACRTQGISPLSASLSGPVSGERGDPVTANFEQIGMVNGHVSHQVEGGFCIAVDPLNNDMDTLANRIAWVKRHKNAGLADHRAHKRVIPRVSHTHAVLASGELVPCFIVDMSSSGVAISADYLPRIGTPLAIGKAVGRVVRHTDFGFAVQFERTFPVETLERVLIKRQDELVEMPRPQMVQLID